MKVITVTLNPSLDKTLYFDGRFTPGTHNRAKQAVEHAGGKGINVARMYRLLDLRATAFGFLGGDNGNILAKKMLAEHIACHFVKTEMPTRCCYKMIDQYGVCTEANEAGGPIREEELRRLISAIDRTVEETPRNETQARRCESEETDTHVILHSEADRGQASRGEDEKVFSFFEGAGQMAQAANQAKCAAQNSVERTYLFLGGSIPDGIKRGIYAGMIEKYQTEHLRVILDADGEALRLGLEARPWLIKPNREELQALVGRPIKTSEEVAQMSRVINNAYHTNVLCTLGEDGAVFTDHLCSLHVTAPKVELKGFTGAGDTFLSCFVFAYEKSGENVSAALRFASAAAAAKIEMVGTALPGRERIVKYLGMPQVRQVAGSLKNTYPSRTQTSDFFTDQPQTETKTPSEQQNRV